MTSLAANALDSRFYPPLKQYLSERVEEFSLIPTDRKSELEKVSQYVQDCISKSIPAKLTFICTHNSRRSHLSQIWAQVASEFYGLPKVETFLAEPKPLHSTHARSPPCKDVG